MLTTRGARLARAAALRFPELLPLGNYDVVSRICTASRAGTHCGLRNLSATGACLRVDDPADVPGTFHLVFDSGEPLRSCRVMWRSARQVGVRFE